MNPESIVKLIQEEQANKNYDISGFPKFVIDAITSNKDVMKLYRYIFRDIRISGDIIIGKRLSKEGLVLLMIYIKSFEYTFKKRKEINLKLLSFLNKNTDYPYFINTLGVVFFEEEISVMYRLYGQDIDTLVEMYQK